MRWVLIRPCNRSPYYDPEIQEPLGLEYLSAVRQGVGDQVLLLDSALLGADDIRLARRALSFEPDVMGFSMTTAQEIESVLAIHRECLRVLSQGAGSPALHRLQWLAGGNFISSDPFQAQRLLPPGFKLVRFEGEGILDKVINTGPPEAEQRTGHIFEGPAIRDLDTLPFPQRPFAAQILGNEWAFNLQGSRGCCGACRYCSSPGMTDPAAQRWRGRSIAHITEEIASLYHHLGARSFNFVDEDFLGPQHASLQRARDFAAEIRQRKLKIAFSIQVRPGTLNEEIIRCLAGVGLIFVFMGLESDDPEDFQRWARPWCPDAWKMVDTFKKYNVEVNAGVMLFHSHSTFAKIRGFARSLQHYGLLNYRTAVNRLDAMPGSVFYKEALARGEIASNHPGPQPLPYIFPEVDAFHRDLLAALAPLGPPAMHALCSQLPLLAHCALSPGKEAETSATKIKEIQDQLDNAVADTLFALLDFYEQGRGVPGIISQLQQHNFEIALAESRNLEAGGFAPSFDMLQEAILLDST